MSIANITIVGNVGGDPETRYTPSGTMNVRFSVAVNHRRTDQSGQQQDITNWYRVTAWGKLAETMDNLTQQGALRKGRQVMVIGRLELREWQDQQGQTRTSPDLTAREFQLLGSRADAEGQMGGGARRETDDQSGGDPGAYDSQDIDDIPF
jgi:single-strand DNA-binding protein